MEFTGIIPEYNIEWCFFTIYILIVLVYPNINKFIIKYNKKLIVYLSFIFYLIGYIQRIKSIIVFYS